MAFCRNTTNIETKCKMHSQLYRDHLSVSAESFTLKLNAYPTNLPLHVLNDQNFSH